MVAGGWCWSGSVSGFAATTGVSSDGRNSGGWCASNGVLCLGISWSEYDLSNTDPFSEFGELDRLIKVSCRLFLKLCGSVMFSSEVDLAAVSNCVTVSAVVVDSVLESADRKLPVESILDANWFSVAESSV